MRRLPSLILLMLCSWAALPVLGSQGTGHIYVALKAREAAPNDVKAIIDANLDAYLVGATGPDIALTTHLVSEAIGWDHPGTEAHYQRTGQLVMNMLKLAGELENEAERKQGLAFALGWLTHFCTDRVVHGMVNEFGGYYSAGGDRVTRHKTLELFECEHVFQQGVGDLSNYSVKSGAVPTELICDAFYRTFPENVLYSRVVRAADPAPMDFEVDLLKSAVQMAYCTDWFANVHKQNLSFTGPVFSTVLKGTPPTPEQYKKLMDPLTIDSVEYKPPAVGIEEGYLTVKYTLEDVLLFKLFAQRWDSKISEAIRDSFTNFENWSNNPDMYQLEDANLDTGGPIGGDYDVANDWPGQPDIKSLLVFLEVKGPSGQDVSPWGPEGQWIPVPFLTPGGANTELSATLETLPGWNGGKAGKGLLKIPVRCPEAGEMTVKLRLALAREADRRVYGWPEAGQVVEAKWEGPTSGQPELSILFLVDTSSSMGGEKIEAAKRAVEASVEQTFDGRTEWALLRFGGCTVSTVCRFTTDPGKMEAAVETLTPGGDTPYIYGREKALKYLVQRGRGKAGRLVILCDGQDNCPEHGSISQPEASAQLQRMFQETVDVTPAAGGGGN